MAVPSNLTNFSGAGRNGSSSANSLMQTASQKSPRYEGLLAAARAPKPKTPRTKELSLRPDTHAWGHFLSSLPFPISPRQFTLVSLLSFLLVIIIHPKCKAGWETPRKLAAAESAVPAVQSEKLTSGPVAGLTAPGAGVPDSLQNARV